MDLLKDITRELRGGDESTQDGQSRTAPSARTDSSGRDAASERATASTDSAGDDSADDGAGDPSRPDIHVCSFCETEFDADRRACPDCDAEIVLRGAR